MSYPEKYFFWIPACFRVRCGQNIGRININLSSRINRPFADGIGSVRQHLSREYHATGFIESNIVPVQRSINVSHCGYYFKKKKLVLALKSTLGTVLSPAEVMYTQAVCHFDIIQSNLENRLVHLVELCTKYKRGI